MNSILFYIIAFSDLAKKYGRGMAEVQLIFFVEILKPFTIYGKNP